MIRRGLFPAIYALKDERNVARGHSQWSIGPASRLKSAKWTCARNDALLPS